MRLTTPRSSIRLALARLRSRPLLTALVIVGLTIAGALPAAMPMYGDAATARLLSAQPFESENYRPAFSYLYWYSADLAEPIGWAEVAETDELLRTRLNEQRLPTEFTTSYVDSVLFELRDPARPEEGPVYGSRSFGALDDFADRAEIVAGRAPAATGDGPIEVLVPDADATLSVGDEIEALDSRADPSDETRTFAAVVVGTWRTTEPDDPRWIMVPTNLESRLLTTRSAVVDRIAADRPDAIRTAAWYTIVDATSLSTDDVDGLLAEAQSTTRSAERLLPGVDVVQSPDAGFEQFRDDTRSLTRRLTAYSIPSLGLLLLFLVLLVSLILDDRRGELAVLHSRGVPRRRLLGQLGLEATITALVSAALALPLARWIAGTMGRSRTFLDMTSGSEPLSTHTSSSVWSVLAIVSVGAVLLQVIPAWRAAGATTASYDARRNIGTRRPWWQRSGVDVAVMVLAAFATWQLSTRAASETGQILDDPMLVLLPALAALGVGLAVLRLLPVVLTGFAFLLARGRGTVALIAARRAARNPGVTTVPLLLLLVTVSTAIFTASLARTLDVQLYDEEFHASGADWVVQERNSLIRPVIQGVPQPRNLLPTERFEEFDGVAASTRVGSYPARIQEWTSPRPRPNEVRLISVEPTGFADIAFFRDDYSGRDRLPDLMAALAAVPEGVLVDRSLAVEIGDRIELGATLENGTTDTEVVVLGFLDDFPRQAADDPPFIVGSLDHQLINITDPGGYEVWLRLDDDLSSGDLRRLSADFDAMDRLAVNESPLLDVLAAQESPTRQGSFGVLTAGFIASLIISVLGFFLASVFEVRKATAELGTLQAMGLPPRKVAAVVIVELGLVMASATAIGVVTGGLLADRLIERMLGDTGLAATPRLLVELDSMTRWTVIGLIAALFVAITVVLGIVLRRMRVFQALKLGEQR